MAKLKLTPKNQKEHPEETDRNWKILVVDDDIGIHSVTRMALKNLRFDGRAVHILSAESAIQAKALLAEEKDIAIALVDVVMETDDAGLRLTRHIREELQNSIIRIILRTGQPGQAPEEEIIVKYDINDYKSKTELTAQKLFLTTITALRTYQHLRVIDAHRHGLQQIIEASDSLSEERSLHMFAAGVLTQLGSLLGVGGHGILCVQDYGTSGYSEDIQILAASEADWLASETSWQNLHIDLEVRELILSTFKSQSNHYSSQHTTLYLGHPEGHVIVAYLNCRAPEDFTRSLMELFCRKIAANFRNLYLYEQLRESNAMLEQKVEDRTRELTIANQLLSKLAATDTLTGIPNRRSFYDNLERESERLARNGGTFSVAMVDIDHFKDINDHHGHQMGDKVLQIVAKQLQQCIRSVDTLGRVGGEEFAVLFSGAPLDVAMTAAERLRTSVATTSAELTGVSVTISLGVVQVDRGETGATALARADKALYAAKENGRNCTYSSASTHPIDSPG
ncbi:diguanylate cyclase [Porticoccus sp.]